MIIRRIIASFFIAAFGGIVIVIRLILTGSICAARTFFTSTASSGFFGSVGSIRLSFSR